MAAGDRVTKILYRSSIPGVGRDTAGALVQTKQLVVAFVDFEYATGGLVLLPKELGLGSYDFFLARVLKAAGDVEPSDAAQYYANLIRSTSKVLIVDNADTQAQVAADTGEMLVLAFGPSTTAPLQA